MTGSFCKFTCFVLVVAGAVACAVQPREEAADIVARPLGAPMEINAPRGLPPLPAEQRPTVEAVALGRRLFYDPRLSSDNTLSCAGCHRPDMQFTDGRPLAAGVGGQLGPRNTPTVLNAAYQPAQFWDGRAASLEEQAGGPVANPKEMNLPHADCVAKLNADAVYRDEFVRVFGPGAITMRKVEAAIASFERTLLSANSAFDRYQYGGEKAALSAAAVRGLAVFTDKQRGNCAACHLIGATTALFTDGKFHNLGTGMNANGELTDVGRFEVSRAEADRGAFRTPSLRNLAATAPYMHDGSLKTLKDVIDFYIGGGSSNPQLDTEIKPLTLTAQERGDLLAF